MASWEQYTKLSSINYSADDFYNQSFVDRINTAQKRIDGLVAEKDTADSKRHQAQDAYNTFFGNMRNYSSLSDEAEDKFGVKTALDTYEKSKHAVSAMEQTLNALPSTINANSNVVMSEQRRNLAFNTMADKWSRNMDTQRQQQDVNKEVWERARENADIYAEQLYGEQKSTLEALSLQWATNTGLWQKATERVNEAEKLKWNIQSDYRNWQWGQAHIQNAYARARAEDALNSYLLGQQYEAINNSEALQRAMMSANMHLQEYQKNADKIDNKIVDNLLGINNGQPKEQKKETFIDSILGTAKQILKQITSTTSLI